MRKSPQTEAGVFNPRLFLAFTFVCFAALVAVIAFAATPSSGTLTDTSGPIEYTAGPFVQPNQSPLGLGQLDDGPRCDNAGFPCDNFDLTVNLPAGFAQSHCNAAIKVSLTWTDTGTGQSDYDLYVFKGPVTTLNGSRAADYQSTSSGYRPEIASVSPLADGTSTYTIKIVPFQPTGETVHVKVELLPGMLNAPCGTAGFGGKDPTVPGAPRYLNFYAPAGSSAEVGNGEFNIGFNPATKRIMTMNAGPIWRLTPPEVLAQAKPECCEAFWEDVTNPATDTPANLDPILWTDQIGGRTFSSNSTAGANAEYGFSDDDGETWLPLSATPPNGGADHQTIATGPYPLIANPVPGGSPIPDPRGNAANHGQAVYYCSQDIVGPATCQRSDTYGLNYGPGVLAYTGNGLEQTIPGVPGGPCGGLHGHMHVAPNGSAWLPVNQCGGLQGGVYSVNAGMTWINFTIPNAFSQQQGADPSIAIDSNNTLYYSYVNNEPVAAGNPPEGHVHVVVGHLTPVTDPVTHVVLSYNITWTNNVDVGASHGVINATHTEAVGGSPGRAAVGFIGTDRPGDYQALDFPGKWYPFIATTYDGGQTWTTVNASPNDPVQSMSGVWQQGGGKTQRNLLDFNEITVDDKGRVLYGYSDGCVTPECIAGTAPNDFVAYMRVARQSGGKGLYAQFDVAEPIAPKAPCLTGTRSDTQSVLTWKVPDNGGSDIVKYQIFRGTAAGAEQLLAETGAVKPEYVDTTASPTVPHYFYTVRAINSSGAAIGAFSNEIDLPIVLPPVPETACTVPGLTLLTDATADSLSPQPGTDLLSVSLAQPFVSNGDIKFVVTMRTDPDSTNTTSKTGGAAWYLAMKVPDATAVGGFRYTGVRMDGAPTGPTFSSYVPGTNTSGGTDGRFVDSSKPAEPGSNYDPNTGKITIIVKASDLGLSPGSIIAGFVAGSSQSSDVANVGIGATEVWDSMPDSLTFVGSYTVQANTACSGSPSVVSRKTHGSAGAFDIKLPTNGGPGVESRGPAGGNYTLVYTFPVPVTSVGSASVTGGSGTASGSMGSNNQEYVVQLSNVPDVQDVTVTLGPVSDILGNNQASVPVTMRVLVGDVNGDNGVNAADSTIARNNSGQITSATNFRSDVNVDGTINSADATVVRNNSGHAVGGTSPVISARGGK